MKRNPLEKALDAITMQHSEVYAVVKDGLKIGLWKTKSQAVAHVNRMRGTEKSEIGWQLITK